MCATYIYIYICVCVCVCVVVVVVVGVVWLVDVVGKFGLAVLVAEQ